MMNEIRKEPEQLESAKKPLPVDSEEEVQGQ